MQLKLKFAIIAAGKSQRQIAADCRIPENRFSEIVRGWTSPKPHERQAIAIALAKAPGEIFDGDTAQVA